MVNASWVKVRRNILAPRREERKVTGHVPSSRTNVRDLRKISPFGRNDNAAPLRSFGSAQDRLLRESLPLALIIYFAYFAFFAALPRRALYG